MEEVRRTLPSGRGSAMIPVPGGQNGNPGLGSGYGPRAICSALDPMFEARGRSA